MPVLDIGTTIDIDGVEWPTAVVDAAEHPEILDLPRMHAMEGIGDIRTEALLLPTDGGDLFLLGVRVTRPVLCAFALAFALPAERHVLEEAADAGHLMVATTPPDRVASDQSLWLASISTATPSAGRSRDALGSSQVLPHRGREIGSSDPPKEQPPRKLSGTRTAMS